MIAVLKEVPGDLIDGSIEIMELPEALDFQEDLVEVAVEVGVVLGGSREKV